MGGAEAGDANYESLQTELYIWSSVLPFSVILGFIPGRQGTGGRSTGQPAALTGWGTVAWNILVNVFHQLPTCRGDRTGRRHLSRYNIIHQENQ